MTDIPSTPQPNPTEEKKRRERQQRQRRAYIGYAIGALIAIWLFQRFYLAPVPSNPASSPTAPSNKSWPPVRS